MAGKIVGNDLLKVYEKVGGKKRIVTVLAWGDPLEVGAERQGEIGVTVNARFLENGEYVTRAVPAFVKAGARLLDPDQNQVMRYSVCDVGQGDASVLETPRGKRIFFDGGENQLFARYLAARYGWCSSRSDRLPVEAIVLTHGDKDHLGGLIEVARAEKLAPAAKRLFIQPRAVFHNGLVKRATDDPLKAFGPTVAGAEEGIRYVTELADDLTRFDLRQVNPALAAWREVLEGWKANGPVRIARLSDKTHTDAFDFLQDEGLTAKVLGPIEETAGGRPALRLFRKPLKEEPEAQGESVDANLKLSRSFSVSHTINGHSIVLLFEYGNVRLLLTGDINREAETRMLERAGPDGSFLRVDILKVPHHGSNDFSTEFLKRLQPVVSVISSGDENERVEYIHPRATLVGALGRYGRLPRPIVFCTELSAFYKYMGRARQIGKRGAPQGPDFYAHQRTSSGIIHFCFDRQRLLVFSHSGKRDIKEAYAVKIRADGRAVPDPVSVH